MKFDISKVIVKDLDGNIRESKIAKNLGNMLYNKTSTLEWLDKCKAIHAGEEIELTEYEWSVLLEIIEHPGCDLVLGEKEPLIDYLKKNLPVK